MGKKTKRSKNGSSKDDKDKKTTPINDAPSEEKYRSIKSGDAEGPPINPQW